MSDLNKFDVKGVKAETLISLLNIQKELSVQTKGVFSRNYSEDLMTVDDAEDKTTLTVARDGIFHLLPQGLFFKENQLNGKPNEFDNEYSELKKRKKEALAFFQPFDSALFKLSLELEQKLNNFAKIGNDIFVDSFGDSEALGKNQYIPKIKKLIPFANQIRGNFPLLADLLANALSVEKVEVKKIERFHLRFIIHKNGLNREEYLAMDKELELFFDYFQHHFLPVEQKYDYKIKDYKHPFTLGTSLILDYNTNL